MFSSPLENHWFLNLELFLDIFSYFFSILFHRYLNVISSVNSRKVIPSYLNPWLHLRFLLVLATRHFQSCPATEVEGGRNCRQVSPTSTTCCKKFSSMNILQHCPSDFVTETAPGYTCNILFSKSLQHQKGLWCFQCW